VLVCTFIHWVYNLHLVLRKKISLADGSECGTPRCVVMVCVVCRESMMFVATDDVGQMTNTPHSANALGILSKVCSTGNG